MPVNGRGLRWGLMALVLASFASFALCRSYSGRPVSAYRGDGTCTTIGIDNAIGYLLTRGYQIDFGRFDLGKASEVTYSISKFPSTRGKYLSFHVEVPDNGLQSDEELKSRLHGQLSMFMKTRDGKGVFHCTGPMEEWWAQSGSGGKVMLWLTKKCCDGLDGESLNANAGYSLTVKYVPGPNDAPLVAMVGARCGGGF